MLKLCLKRRGKSQKEKKRETKAETLQKGSWRPVPDFQKLSWVFLWCGWEKLAIILFFEAEDSFVRV